MKILTVTQYFWPEGFRINDVVKSLVENNEEVDVLTGKPNYPDGKVFAGYRLWGLQTEDRGGADIFRLPIISRGVNSPLRLVLNYISFIVSGILLGPWLLRGKHYDVVFVYAPSPILQAIPAIFVAWIKGCPVVLWVQDLWPESLEATGYIKQKWVLGCVEKIVRFIYRHTDMILVQSRAFEAGVNALCHGKPIRYYPNSVEAMFCNPPDIDLPQVSALNDGFSVVFAGNVGVAQAVEVIVEAANLLKNHKDIHIVIFGQGSRWVWMCQEAKDLGLTNLHFPGRFPIETMPGLMAKSSALLVTLTNKPIFASTVPNKIQAYMAAGKPILACLNGEGARLVEEANAGLTVPAESAQGLAKAILELYQMSPEARYQMGVNGREYYKNNFDHDALVAQLIGYLREASEFHRSRV